MVSQEKREHDKLVELLSGQCEFCHTTKKLVLHHIYLTGRIERDFFGREIYRYYLDNLTDAKEQLRVFCRRCHLLYHRLIMDNANRINAELQFLADFRNAILTGEWNMVTNLKRKRMLKKLDNEHTYLTSKLHKLLKKFHEAISSDS